MAKSSGGGGRSGGKARAIGGGAPITVTSERSRSGGYRWKRAVTEAREVSPGVIELSRPTGKYTDINRNTTRASYTITAGVYHTNNSGRTESHNINWENVRVVRGDTYPFRGYLKERGFRWNGTEKQWERGNRG